MISVRSLHLLFSVALFYPTAHAFSIGGFTVHPALHDLAKAQTDCKLSIRFDIGKKPRNRREQPVPHLFLDGLELQLLQEPAPSGTVLPGASGRNPKTSSGARAVKVTEQPYYIGMDGKQTVEMQNAGWEMVWRDQRRCGSIICGLDVLQEAVRNKNDGAKLRAGRVYLAFPVWTPELLAEHQVKKAEVEQRANTYMQRKNDKLAAIPETDSLLTKAMLYREAAEAAELYELTAVHTLQSIPSIDQVVQIQDGLLMNTNGIIWKKDSNGKQVELGDALVRAKMDKSTLRP